MNIGLGVALVVVGGMLGSLVVFAAWGRPSRFVSLAALAGCGMLAGAGALLVQDRASPAEWAVTLVVLGALTPLHAMVVFGRPGTAR